VPGVPKVEKAFFQLQALYRNTNFRRLFQSIWFFMKASVI